MDDRHPSRDTDDAGVESDHEPTGTPLWVKVLGIIVLLVVVLALLILLLAGGHGPGVHT